MASSSSSPPVASSSRPPPPVVAPVELDGVRFEEAGDGLPLDASDTSGWLRATDIATGATLWLVQVYIAPSREPGMPAVAGGPDTVYMRLLSLSDGFVIVEDEIGRRFRVDPTTGASTAMP